MDVIWIWYTFQCHLRYVCELCGVVQCFPLFINSTTFLSFSHLTSPIFSPLAAKLKREEEEEEHIHQRCRG